MSFEDQDIEDLLENLSKKKSKAKGKPKGKRGELEIVKILNSRFEDILLKNPEWGKFSRTVGSGNRWGQNVVLSKEAMNTFSGDLTCPQNFLFVIESKNGYDDIDLNASFDSGHKEIDKFLGQVLTDSERCGRKPILIWKKGRKNRIAFIKKEDWQRDMPEYYMSYRDWYIFSLDLLLSLKDDFFFAK